MKSLLILGFLWLVSSAYADIITNGLSITAARKAMESAGYKWTRLEMLPTDFKNNLQFWRVDQGVLIMVYSTNSTAIIDIEFFLSDERPKAFRKTFDFDVTSFDSHTGLMTIRTRKGEPGGAENGSQPIRSETNRTSSATGPGR